MTIEIRLNKLPGLRSANSRDTAYLFGITERGLQRWVRAGCPSELVWNEAQGIERRRYDVLEVFKWLEARPSGYKPPEHCREHYDSVFGESDRGVDDMRLYFIGMLVGWYEHQNEHYLETSEGNSRHIEHLENMLERIQTTKQANRPERIK